MEAFLGIAGVVGFVASINGIINLCERALSLLNQLRLSDVETERAQIETILATYKILKSKEASVDQRVDDTLPLCNAVVYRKITKVLVELRSERFLNLHDKSIIRQKLDDVDKVLNSYVRLLLVTPPVSVESSSAPATSAICSTEEVAAASLLDGNKLLRRLLDPNNKNVINKATLRKKGVYNDNLELPPNCRRADVEGKTYMVERIAVGKTPKETEKRLTRLGKLIIIMQENEEENCANLLLISKIVMEQNSFCILSELKDANYTLLEYMLPNLRASVRRKILVQIRIAEAVQKLHEMLIVHEGLNSQNILVQWDSLDIKLTGFVSSRMLLDLSDCATSSASNDKDIQKRDDIFQAPERLAGSRYSFECDVYSLGMVMAEVCIGWPLVSKDNIMSLVEQSNMDSAIVGVIRDCVLAETASKRPSACEIVDRLSRIDLERLCF